jgi:hypothetical protein
MLFGAQYEQAKAEHRAERAMYAARPPVPQCGNCEPGHRHTWYCYPVREIISEIAWIDRLHAAGTITQAQRDAWSTYRPDPEEVVVAAYAPGWAAGNWPIEAIRATLLRRGRDPGRVEALVARVAEIRAGDAGDGR